MLENVFMASSCLFVLRNINKLEKNRRLFLIITSLVSFFMNLGETQNNLSGIYPFTEWYNLFMCMNIVIAIIVIMVIIKTPMHKSHNNTPYLLGSSYASFMHITKFEFIIFNFISYLAYFELIFLILLRNQKARKNNNESDYDQ